MPLSQELQLLHEAEPRYKGDPFIVSPQINDKILNMIEAPTNSGKTELITGVVDIMPDANAVPSRTDRYRKDGDPARYETGSDDFTLEDIIEDIRQGIVVNYAVFKTGNVYATYPHHYTARNNFLPTMVSGIPQLERADFEATNEIYILMAANAWRSIVEAKNFKGQRKNRMEEGIESLEYARTNIDRIEFIYNKYGRKHLGATAAKLMLAATGHGGYDKNKALERINTQTIVAKDLARRPED